MQHVCFVKPPVRRVAIAVLLCLALGFKMLPAAFAAKNMLPEMTKGGLPDQFKDVTITEHLGQDVAGLGLEFVDETGTKRALSSYFDGKRPVVLTLGYFQCPHLCTLVLNGLTDTLKTMDWSTLAPTNQYQMLSVSIEPKENAALAMQKKGSYIDALMSGSLIDQTKGRAQIENGWHFLTGQDLAIKKLASTVGFGYRWDPVDQQYAHTAAIFILTPQGKISRYLYGINYAPQDLRKALVEATDGKIGTLMDRFIMYCFRYNSHARKYTLVATRVMQAGGLLTTLLLGGYIFTFWRRNRKETLTAC